jgi:hypothetical protein
VSGFHRLIPHYEINDEISTSTSLTDTLALAWFMADSPEAATEKVNLIRAMEVASPQFILGTNSECSKQVVQFSRLAGLASP